MCIWVFYLVEKVRLKIKLLQYVMHAPQLLWEKRDMYDVCSLNCEFSLT